MLVISKIFYKKILNTIEEEVVQPIREIIEKLDNMESKQIVKEELNKLIKRIGEVEILA